jgi:ABC-type branched-subunit amino acid transport system substrate-binding protein
MVERWMWSGAALCAVAMLVGACGGTEGAEPPASTAATATTTNVGSGSPSTATSGPSATTATTSTTPAPTTTTSWGVREDRTLVGPSGFTVDLNRCPDTWRDDAGVSPEAIRIGASAPLTGQFTVLGAVVQGFQARLAEANAAGGIDGRRVEVTVLDDRWDPIQSGANASALSEDDGVLAFAGTFGTGHNGAISSVAEARCVPLLAGSAQAAFSDLANRPWSIGTLGSWNAEVLIAVQQIAAEQPAGTRLLLAVDDEPEYSPTIIRAAQAAVAATPSVELLPAVYVPRDGSGVGAAVDRISAAAPTAVIVATNEGGAVPLLTALAGSSIAPDQRWTTGGTSAALKAAGVAGWRVVRSADPPAVAANPFETGFLSAVAGVPTTDRGAFWAGYVQAEVLIIALRDAADLPGGVTRTNLLLAVRSLDVEYPGAAGIRLHTDGIVDPWAIEGAVITSFDGSTFVPISLVDVDGQTAGCAAGSATSIDSC